MVKKISFKFSNRWLYTFIVFGIIAIFGVGVYAVTAGTAPNPGHLLSEVSPPAGCSNGQYIKWDGTNLICSSVPSSQWMTSGSNVYYDTGNVGIGTTLAPGAKLHVISETGDAIYGRTYAGKGVYGFSLYSGTGIHGYSASGWAGFFDGKVNVINGNIAIANGGLELGQFNPRPTCNEENRGKVHFVKAGAGIDDALQICVRLSDGYYYWQNAQLY